MSLTLFITGALAPKAMKRQLAGEKGGLVMLEYDTLLDHSSVPQATAWLKPADFISYEEIEVVRGDVARLMSHFLKHRPELGDRPGDSVMRKAALVGGFQDFCFTRIVNSRVRDCLWRRFKFDRIVITAGSGVNFGFWKEVARENHLETVVLEPEWRGRTLARRIERWRCKRISKNKAKSVSVAARAARPARDDEGLPLAVCVTRRMRHLLMLEEKLPDFRIINASLEELGETDSAVLASETARFADWWKSWEREVLQPGCKPGAEPFLGTFRQVFEEMGAHYTTQVYPRWMAMKARARAWLQERCPALIIADTQINEEEVIWCLAAADLGIPVAGYTYDCLADPMITYCPDFLLLDGARGLSRVLKAGYPRERIIDVRCHRVPAEPRRTEAETEASFKSRRPMALLADSMSLMNDPQEGLRLYRLLIEAARRLPDYDFKVKFHPLRVPKSEQRSFLGMDEMEVRIKTDFIRSLRPPRNFALIPPEADMQDCLRQAAVLLNTISLTGQEAFHFGIPVVFLSHHAPESITFPNMQDWMQTLQADTVEDLVGALRRLADSREFRQAHIRQQHRYQDDYFWASKVSLSEGINEAARRAATLSCLEQ